MTPAEKEARIRAVVAHYCPLLHLEHWVLELEFYQTRADMGAAEDQCEAGCAASPEYQFADLAFTLDEMEPGEMERDTLHEMVHAIGWPTVHVMDFLLKQHEADNRLGADFCRWVTEQSNTHFERVLWDALPRCP